MTTEATEAAPFRDAYQPTDVRVADLLGRMERVEKIAQLGSAWPAQFSDGERFDAEQARDVLKHGLGQVTRISGSTLLRADGAARLANDLQRYLLEHTRLGVPALLHEESLHGLTALGSVVHAQSIGLAATWDPSAVEGMGAHIGRAAIARGVPLVLSPVLDITRDPRWGRTEETFGEDAYLVMVMGTAYVRGVQGEGVLACGKHFVGHGMSEGGLNRAPVRIGARELREQFLLPFEAAVRQEGLGTVMHAYHEFDGLPCVASRELLTGILRDEWGFEGIVVGDYDSVNELVVSHRMTSDLAVAAAMALNAGLDSELPRTIAFGEPLERALDEGLVTMATLDVAVARVLRLKFELGLFEHPYVDAGAASIDLTDEHAHALESARKSIVLLKNDGTLPLADTLTRIALIGPSAADPRNLVGDYAHQLHVETLLDQADTIASATPVAASLRASSTTDAIPTVLMALGTRVSAQIDHARGCGLIDGSDAEIETAVALARAADVAIVVAGERSGLTDDAISGEARDRLELGLPGRQQELLEALVATGTPVVLVLIAGRPLAIPWAAEHCAAIVHAWVPGEHGSQAIAEVLTGTLNPGGKLPISVPRSVGQVPIYYGHKPSGGHSNWKVTYVEGSNLPLWPFGFGLSYTEFSLSDLRLSTHRMAADGAVEVRVDVTNTGTRRGDEVVQLYVRDLEASLTRPVKELRGFARVSLLPGERKRVTFHCAAELLAYVDEPGRWLVEPGSFRLMVGTSSEDLPLATELVVTGPPRHITARTHYRSEVSVR